MKWALVRLIEVMYIINRAVMEDILSGIQSLIALGSISGCKIIDEHVRTDAMHLLKMGV